MSRVIRFTLAAWEDYTWWQERDKKTLKRINTLIEAARRDPFDGIGKPEPLLGNLAGYWSRRIDETHRLVYAADDTDLDVIACRGPSPPCKSRLKADSGLAGMPGRAGTTAGVVQAGQQLPVTVVLNVPQP